MKKNVIRKRKIPSRYGEVISDKESSSETDIYADNSMDDPDFEVLNNKKRKTDESISDESLSEEIQQNFDDEFDQIESMSTPVEKSHTPCDQTVLNNELNLSADQKHIPSREDGCDAHLDGQFLRNKLLILEENTIQILTRIAVIEKTLIKAGSLVTIQNEETEKKAFEKFYNFSESNNLPMKSLDDIKRFETKLNDKDFKEEAFTAFSEFPGIKPSLGNKPKVLKRVIFQLIEKTALAFFTWTGKVPKGQKRKIAFRDYMNILQFLHRIVSKLDGKYAYELFLDHLKNKVISQAYGYAKNSIIQNVDNTEISPEPSTSSISHNKPYESKQHNSLDRTGPTNSNVQSCSQVGLEPTLDLFSERARPVTNSHNQPDKPRPQNILYRTKPTNSNVQSCSQVGLEPTLDLFSERARPVTNSKYQFPITSKSYYTHPSEHASMAKTEMEYFSQPCDPSLLYGSTISSVPGLNAIDQQNSIHFPGNAKKKPSLWPDSWKHIMSSDIQMEYSRGKKLLSLAQANEQKHNM